MEKNCIECKNWEEASNLGFQNSEGIGVCFFINKLQKLETSSKTILSNDIRNGFSLSLIMNNFNDDEKKIAIKLLKKIIIMTHPDFGCPKFQSKKVNMQNATNGLIRNN